MKRLLVISCSERKVPSAGLLPAMSRYDGPAFWVLRKYLREKPTDVSVILILSAKYGLIAADRRITDYDCRLTATSAAKLRPKVLETVKDVLETGKWSSVGICVSKVYRITLNGVLELIPAGTRVDFIEGGQGKRLTALRTWLHQRE